MRKPYMSHLILFVLLLSTFANLNAQVTIWMEDFNSYPNGTLDAPGKWTSVGTDCDDPGLNIGNQFGVFGGQFVVNEVEGAPCCTPAGGGNDNHLETVGIDISNYCDVEVSLTTAGSGGLDCESPADPLWTCQGTAHPDDWQDQMYIEIEVDGVVVQTKYICGTTGLGPANFTGINGNTLVIRVFAATKFGSETYTFDNIEVTAQEPQPVSLSINPTSFCPSAAPTPLPPSQSGVNGDWSGPGVSGNIFNPANAGPGTHTVTFTPDPGQCALENTIDLEVYPIPAAFSTSAENCSSPLTNQATFNLTDLNDNVNGGSGFTVNWFTNAAGTIPIANPANFSTPNTVTVYAKVTDGNGCQSNPVPVTLIVNTCSVPGINLSCDAVNDVNSCTLCEDGFTPGEDVSLYVNFPAYPPGGYGITVRSTGASGTQTVSFGGYTGGPLNFNISETTTFSLIEVVCPNGCVDLTGLGDQVTFNYVPAPNINNPGPQSACDTFILPAITGQNLPPNVGYFTQPNGTGTKYNPGQAITDSVVLYIYANVNACTDQEIFSINITPVADTTFLQSNTCDTAAAGVSVQNFQSAAGCDSVVVTTVTLVANDTTLISLATCSVQDTGVMVQVFAGQDCDSVVITTTTLLPSNVTILNQITCDPSGAGSDTLSLINQFGCDSLVITNSTYAPTDTTLIAQFSCNPQDTGVVVALFNVPPCDSVVITTTILAPTDTVLLQETTCDMTMVGVDTVVLTNQFSCDSVVITNTVFSAADTTLLTQNACNPADTGTVTQVLQGTLCDSIVITVTSLIPPDTLLIQRQSCDPAQAGVVDSAFVDALGCPAIAVITTTLLPPDTVLIMRESCDPTQVGVVDSAFVDALGCPAVAVITTTRLLSDTVQIMRESCNPAQAGVVDSLYLNAFGCLSVATITTTLLPSDTMFVTQQTCDPAQVGTLDSVYINTSGCPSLLTVTTTLLPSDTVQIARTSCDATQVGTVDSVYTNSFGCTSLAMITTTLLPSDTVLIMRESCDPLQVGTVDSVYFNAVGCPSLAVINTSLLPSDTVQIARTSCDSTQVGATDSIFFNAFGCQSLAIITTTLLPSDVILLEEVTCDSAQAGVVDSFFINAFGCPSVVRTTTTLLPPDTIFLERSTCDPQQPSPVDSAFTNTQGCLTVAVITFNILPSDTISIVQETCDPALAGVVDSTFVNAFGCESLVRITTNLLPSDSVFLEQYTCDPTQAGIFDSTYINAFGCESHVFTEIVYTPPVFTDLNDTLCFGDSLLVNGTVYNANNPTGQEVLVAGSSGCDSAIVSINLTFSELDASIFVENPACDDAPVGVLTIASITAGKAPFTYQVDNGAQVLFDSVPVTIDLPSGAYVLTIQGSNGCSWQEQVTVQTPQELVLALGADQTVNLGEQVLISPTANFDITAYQWTPAALLPCDTCPELSFIPSQSMNVVLVATDPFGCRAVDSVLIFLSRERFVFIPNVFNPERQDGLNDIFFLSAAEGQVRRIVDFQVYDRWGSQIFGRKDIMPNDRNAGWDGTVDGDPVMPGVYVYYIEVEYADNSTQLFEGDVTVIR